MAWGECPSRCLVCRGGQPSGSVVPAQQLQLHQGQNTLHSLEGSWVTFLSSRHSTPPSKVLGSVSPLPSGDEAFSPRLQRESCLKSQEGLDGSGFPGAQCQAACSEAPYKPGTLTPDQPGQATSTGKMRYLATGHNFYWVCPPEILG